MHMIAKGRSDCEAERDTIVQGFNDLLRVLKDAKNRTEEHAKAALYDIIHDESLSDEERRTEMKGYTDLLSEQEETDIKIRRTILIGLFSFWETSLRNICDYYKIAVKKANIRKTPNKLKPDKEPIYNVTDYLTAIFHSNLPDTLELINSKIKELRNYMTHGSADAERMAIVDSLITDHPEFGIRKTANHYHIASYDGLDHILKVLNDGTVRAEMTAKTLERQTNQS